MEWNLFWHNYMYLIVPLPLYYIETYSATTHAQIWIMACFCGEQTIKVIRRASASVKSLSLMFLSRRESIINFSFILYIRTSLIVSLLSKLKLPQTISSTITINNNFSFDIIFTNKRIIFHISLFSTFFYLEISLYHFFKIKNIINKLKTKLIN